MKLTPFKLQVLLSHVFIDDSLLNQLIPLLTVGSDSLITTELGLSRPLNI